jgi:hypothetical protein
MTGKKSLKMSPQILLEQTRKFLDNLAPFHVQLLGATKRIDKLQTLEPRSLSRIGHLGCLYG